MLLNLAIHPAHAYDPKKISALYEESNNDIAQIEFLTLSGNYAEAKLRAKQIIDRVSVIQPQTRAIKRVAISGVLTAADLTKSFDDLDFNQKDQIATILESEKLGQYMNLLNLLKRAQFLYEQAYYLQFKGELLEMDLKSIQEGLLSAYSIPIYLQNDELEEPFLLFDSDIANPMHQNMFNRELVSFLISIPELKLTEKLIEAEIQNIKLTQLNDHWASLSINKNPEPQMALGCHTMVRINEGRECRTAIISDIFAKLTFSGGGNTVCSNYTKGFDLSVVGTFQIADSSNTVNKTLATDFTSTKSESNARRIANKLKKTVSVCPN